MCIRDSLYAAGGMAAALGNTLFALRLTAAFFGLLTVAATYWLGREMLADRRIALLAAALLAVSFWHVLFSRLGFRVISQPLLMALAVAALFRGLRGGRWPVSYTHLISALDCPSAMRRRISISRLVSDSKMAEPSWATAALLPLVAGGEKAANVLST